MTLDLMMSMHLYREVADESERQLREHPDDQALLGWHARAMLCLGRLTEALEEFRRLDERERASPFGSPGRTLILGVILWLLGRREAAIETFASAVDGIEDGSIKLGDSAGGVSQGLLLWYAGVTARDAVAKEQAVCYLGDRAKRAAISEWPGPVALFALGRLSREDVLVQACGTRDPRGAMQIAEGAMLKRRRLIKALFYFGTQARELSSEEQCMAQMRSCASLENPIVELEWFLARGEVASGR